METAEPLVQIRGSDRNTVVIAVLVIEVSPQKHY
jgi:hypothetical protein